MTPKFPTFEVNYIPMNLVYNRLTEVCATVLERGQIAQWTNVRFLPRTATCSQVVRICCHQ